MFIFELLALIIVVLVLLYLAFFSPKFDRLMTRLFSKNPETATGIAVKVQNINAEKAAAQAAITSRSKALADEKAALDNIQVK